MAVPKSETTVWRQVGEMKATQAPIVGHTMKGHTDGTWGEILQGLIL